MTASNSLIKIGEFADLARTNLRTLRYYEEIGLLVPDHRSEGGFRYYRREALERMNLISELQDLGLPLDRIRQLLSHREPQQSREVWLDRLRAALAEHRELIRSRMEDLRAQEERLEVATRHLQHCSGCDCTPCPENNFCQPCTQTKGDLPRFLSGMF